MAPTPRPDRRRRSAVRAVRAGAAAWRRLALLFALPLCMLLSQQGAWQHELGHLRGAATAGESGRQQPASQPCESCLAYAQVASIAQPGVPLLVLPSLSHARPVASAVVFGQAEAPRPRSRGPPAFL